MEANGASNSIDRKRVSLESLCKGSSGITPAFGTSLAEAASVCLESQQHQAGVELSTEFGPVQSILGDPKATFALHWVPTTEQIRKCWSAEEVATEIGAYGIAALLVQALTGKSVLERSRKGTGFDYWIGTENDDSLFQTKTRLEVSGIRAGTIATIMGRLHRKLEQTKRSDAGIPALVIIVEFSRPCSFWAER